MTGGADSDGVDLDAEFAFVFPASVFFVESLLDGLLEARVEGFECLGVGAALVELEPCLEGDGVDRGSAADEADVEGGLGVGRNLEIVDVGDGAAGSLDGIRNAEGTVAVTAGTGEGHAVSVAADSDVGDASGFAGFDGDEFIDIAFECGPEEFFHAAKVAGTLFADVGDEGDGASGGEVHVVHGVDDREESGEAAAVIANTRAFEDASGAGDVDVCLGWEDGVEVCGEDEMWVRLRAGTIAEDVSCMVDSDVGEAGFFEEMGEFGGALVFVEGRRGYLAEAYLLVDEVWLAGPDGLHRGLDFGTGKDLSWRLGMKSG